MKSFKKKEKKKKKSFLLLCVSMKEYPKGPSNIICSNPHRIPTSFFIQGHVLGHGPHAILM
jgi:hypothetical protein